MTDKTHDAQEADKQKPAPVPKKVSDQVPKNPPPPNRSQVADINPPSAPPGHRDREQI